MNEAANPDPLDAAFDFFEVRSLTPSEKNDPEALERQKLYGTWEVAACHFDGEPWERPPLSRFAFDGRRLTVTEGERSVETEYTLDVVNDRKTVLMSGVFGRGPGPVPAVYSLEQDSLVLCFNPSPESPAPDKLETNEGDGRFLITLRRMSADEVAALRRNRRPTAKLFEGLDKNYDERLTLNEYLVDRTGPEAVKQGVEVFKLLDQDGDGQLTFDEFRTRSRKIQFMLWDLDGDGNWTIREFFNGEMRSAPAERARRVFALTDQDGDGLVSLSEALARTSGAWYADGDGLLDFK